MTSRLLSSGRSCAALMTIRVNRRFLPRYNDPLIWPAGRDAKFVPQRLSMDRVVLSNAQTEEEISERYFAKPGHG